MAIKRERSDESDEPAIDRLDEHPRLLISELLWHERSPVAMVGSGLSIICGGVAWTRSVELCRDYATGRLRRTIGPPQRQYRRSGLPA